MSLKCRVAPPRSEIPRRASITSGLGLSPPPKGRFASRFELTATRYSLNSLRYDLQKLKGHGLLEREPRRYAYRLTEKVSGWRRCCCCSTRGCAVRLQGRVRTAARAAILSAKSVGAAILQGGSGDRRNCEYPACGLKIHLGMLEYSCLGIRREPAMRGITRGGSGTREAPSARRTELMITDSPVSRLRGRLSATRCRRSRLRSRRSQRTPARLVHL